MPLPNQTLTVYAQGTALVPDLDALKANARRYIGRTYDPTLGPAGGWPPKSEPTTIPAYQDYRKAVRDGDLKAADATTAHLCGVPLTP